MEKNEQLNKKIKVIKIISFLIAVAVFAKFWIVTVYQHEGFSELAKYQSTVEVSQQLPRGEIFDSEGKLLAGNKLTYDLSYVEANIKTPDELMEDAQKIAKLVDIDSSNLREDDLKDLWLTGTTDDEDNFKIAAKRIDTETNDRLTKLKEDNDESYTSEVNKVYRDQVTEDEVNSLRKEYGDDALYVRVLMMQSTPKNPVIIKSNLTLDEKYQIDSMTGQLGGFYTVDDWQRTYPQGDTIRSFIGEVGQIQEDDRTLYQSQGYDLDEEVGISYLEKELEPILHSTNQKLECYFDEEGNLIKTEVTDSGELGNDVQLTINIKFQKYVESIVKKQLSENDYPYNTTSFATVTDPQTGNILAMAGQTGENEFSIGNFISAYPVGSIVKPAVLLMGYDLGKWDWNTYVYDAPMYIKGTPVKASYHNYGSLNEITALAKSSNVYFYQLLLKIAGETYEPYGPLNVEEKYFDIVRQEFEQFGLGTSTGIQVENEAQGFRGTEITPGKYMDLANGQYDTYTNLQVAQYVSTIANGGTRYRINYLKKITTTGEQGKLGKVIYEQKPEQLNSLTMSEKDINHTKEGMYACVDQSYGTGNTGGYNNLSVPSACKTGTSEDFYVDASKIVHSVNNASFISFAPRDKPEIAISILLPYYTDGGNFTATRRNGAYYAKMIQDYYYEEIK